MNPGRMCAQRNPKENSISKPMNLMHEDISRCRFEDLNMSRSEFNGVNLSASRFHDVNFSDFNFAAAQIGGTTFKHIGPPDGSPEQQRPVTFEEGTLRDSVFRKVDMSNVKLSDCNIQGMTIDGVLMSDLLDAFKQNKK